MYNVAVIGGDGIGPEITSECLKVLKTASSRHNIPLDFVHYDLGAKKKANHITNSSDDIIVMHNGSSERDIKHHENCRAYEWWGG